MTETAELYFALQRITANTPEAKWVLLVDLVDGLQGVGNDANQKMRTRSWIDANPDCGFYWDTGEVDQEDDPILKWYPNTLIYAANFPVNAIQFQRFADKLETAFGLQPGSVTYTTQQVTLRHRPSVVATFTHNAINYFRVSLLGCASDSELCTVKESNQEALQLLVNDPDKYGEVVDDA